VSLQTYLMLVISKDLSNTKMSLKLDLFAISQSQD